jgi:hypothetical protein
MEPTAGTTGHQEARRKGPETTGCLLRKALLEDEWRLPFVKRMD